MGSLCYEHHHHHHHLPPRKLLSRRSSLSSESSDYYSSSHSPRGEAAALMQKFLPCNTRHARNNDSDELSDTESDDPYSSDVFRMYEFKIRKCTRSRSHDWTDCPFAHPGEKAKRRDPRRFQYSGTVCPEYRRTGGCPRADECEFAHGVFECWLHPARYRTEACKDGKNCKRKVCFFAHSPRELRVPPPEENGEERECKGERERRGAHGAQQCCRYCCAISPTSTLTMDMSNFSPPMSPSLSPPRSPMKPVGLSGFSPVSRYSNRGLSACGSSTGGSSNKGLSYEDMVIAELLGSFEGMSINNPGHKLSDPNASGLWVDVGYDNSIADYDTDHHQYINNSPVLSTRNYNFNANSDSSRNYYGNYVTNDSKAVNDGGSSGPDIGWVNDLLM